MKRKITSDTIMNEADYAAIHEEMKEYQDSHPDPRHEYHCTYLFNGTELNESVFAFDLKSAEEQVKQQCALVGVTPINLKVVAAENTNISIN